MVKSTHDSKTSRHEADEGRDDITIEELNAIYARAATQKFDENPRYAASYTMGSIPMSIKGRFENERERLGPDFNERERLWRVKWIQDQRLHPLEPFEVKQLYKDYYNPVRRFYRAPLELFERTFAKYTNKECAYSVRHMIGKGALVYFGICGIWYYIKYNNSSWERYKGVRIFSVRERVFPGDERFPYPKQKTESWQFFDRGFSKRKVYLEPEKYEFASYYG